MNSIGPPILTHITSTYLECTLHVVKYHCLLRLRSIVVKNGDVNNNQNQNYVATPDISTLSAFPIQSKQMNTRIQNENGIKLFDTTHTSGRNNNNTNNNKTHPSHELIRIAQSLEVQLKERLKDASDGVIANNNSINMNNLSAANIQEEFLVKSEAVMCELLSAVQQQLRKEKSQSSISGGTDRNNSRKRKASSGQSASSLSPPPLKYFSSLTRQLSVLQSMPTVTDITLHKNESSDGDESASADLTSLSVTCLDDQKRSHTWHAELYPSIVLTMDMPSEFVLEDKNIRLDKWWEDGNTTSNNNTQAANNETLPRIQHHFDQALVKHQPLFNELDDLDAHLWILEPSLPARRCSVERRIALWEGGASMVIVLDPENARGVPVMTRFLGVAKATMLAAAYASGDGNSGDVVDWRTSFATFVAEDNEQEDSKKKSHENNTKRWTEERSIRENLELWFGSPLPSPLAPSTDKSDFLVECGICYTHRLPTEDGSTDDGPLPEAKCSNPSCNRHYHESCLFEWLHSLPTAKISFDRLYGSCPYCTETLSVLLNNKR